ncbi:putative 1-aminocyclopropane-1-carboxylate oxidase 5-like isoform X2 [Capsicum annuum]|uniref:1-aminocyclopropane-1-carboxylate oxidase 5-like n=1 Tax=Capsicum annuum TaxID=4072 RepID=UPI0007BF87AF|nr:1-aminocyclopropane-1-carboxylate oxidase 5-like [Capsicum annuum]KAF3620159.1 putative 1-aminocyclopropane-1-carboxylate oxidase 5-like isoform X2 [Capsicum annuum]KAF3627102.1 putative 1-aminocyclopropane-1-carboxylate oxidase 5-like isoform X2 [Capsicum annuum]
MKRLRTTLRVKRIKENIMASLDIPTIDFSLFFSSEENVEGKKKVMEQMGEACSNYGFFQIANHGIPLDLLSRTMDMYKTFFACSDEEKLLVPDSYFKSTQSSAETYEHLAYRLSSSGFPVCPKNPPHFKQVLDEMVSHFIKLGVVLEGIISEYLGLPPKFLSNYKNDQSRDALIGLHYFPATEAENTGKPAHEDLGFFTILYQDEVGGLQVHKDDQWIPIAPCKDKLVVNIGDVIQVLSNNKFKSATHRVVRPRETNRYSYVFFYNVQGDRWVEPLPQFTKDIGESPKYRGFLFGEYMQLRIRNMTHPPAKPEDLIHITHYSISN